MACNNAILFKLPEKGGYAGYDLNRAMRGTLCVEWVSSNLSEKRSYCMDVCCSWTCSHHFLDKWLRGRTQTSMHHHLPKIECHPTRAGRAIYKVSSDPLLLVMRTYCLSWIISSADTKPVLRQAGPQNSYECPSPNVQIWVLNVLNAQSKEPVSSGEENHVRFRDRIPS